MRLILLVCFLSAAWAATAEVPTIISYENNNDGLGKYNFAFQTSDGTKRQEQSEIVNAGDPEKESLIVRGSFSYIGPDGVTYTVTYIADENGFQPLRDRLPVRPPPPPPQKHTTPINIGLFQTSTRRPVQPIHPPGLIPSLLGK